jgi:rhodanese-related sulfurtransferase
LLTYLSVGTVLAGTTPTELAGGKVATAEEVKAAIETGATVIDTRVANEYAEAHIKGAISVPYREKSAKEANYDPAQDRFDLGKLPAAKDKTIVTYCNGPECWKSFKAAVAAIKGGYSNVLWYRQGLPDWKSKGLPVE